MRRKFIVIISLSPLKRRLKDCFCLRTFFLAYHKKDSQNRALSAPRKRALKMKHLRRRVFHPKTSRKDDAHQAKVEAGVTDLLCNKAKKERRWWSWTHITWRRGPRRHFFQSWWFRRDFARCGWCQKCTHSFVSELWNTHVCTDKPHYTLYLFHMWTSKVGNDWLSDKKTQDFSLFIWRKNAL